jgi:ATP-dependent RNA helicase DDX49/DBP8
MESSAGIELFGHKHKKRKGTTGVAKKVADPPQAIATASEVETERPERWQAGTSTSSPADDRADTTFKSLGVTDWLCSVCSSLGIVNPTQVQAGCIPAILSGKDVIGTAQTGSGKTAAFALPILQTLAQDPYGVYALVLTPTRWVLASCLAAAN